MSKLPSCPSADWAALLSRLFEGAYLLDLDRRIVYWNAGAEKLTGYSAAEVLGRSCSADILVHVDGSGRCLCSRKLCPVARVLRTGREEAVEAYACHKQGHRVPVAIRILPCRDEAGKVTGALQLFQAPVLDGSLAERLRELEHWALRDSLTGVGNRRYGQIQLEAHWNRFKRGGPGFGVVMCDLDSFKEVNDSHGHAVGDQVLKMVAETLIRNVRSYDQVARWGGEEFVVIAECADGVNLREMAEKLRLLVSLSGFSLPDGRRLTTTISCGATLCRPQDSCGRLLDRADELLYRSKKAGRNRITCDR